MFRCKAPETPKEQREKMAESKRTKSIKIWLTPDEHEKLNDLKTGQQLATWMRETCLGKRSKRKGKTPTVDPVLLRHLAAIGNNINQIAKQCNTTLSPTDTLDVIVRLDAIEQVLNELRNDHACKDS